MRKNCCRWPSLTLSHSPKIPEYGMAAPTGKLSQWSRGLEAQGQAGFSWATDSAPSRREGQSCLRRAARSSHRATKMPLVTQRGFSVCKALRCLWQMLCPFASHAIFVHYWPVCLASSHSSLCECRVSFGPAVLTRTIIAGQVPQPAISSVRVSLHRVLDEGNARDIFNDVKPPGVSALVSSCVRARTGGCCFRVEGSPDPPLINTERA